MASLDTASQSGAASVISSVANSDAELHDVMLWNEFRFCLQHHDDRILVCSDCGENTIPAYIGHLNIDLSPGMIWRCYRIHVSVISCLHSRCSEQRLLCFCAIKAFDSTRCWNSSKFYDSGRWCTILVCGNAQTFLDTENIWLLSWLVYSLDILPIENICLITIKQIIKVRELLGRHH